MSGRACQAADCDSGDVVRHGIFCADHEHEWVGAGEVPLDASVVSTAVRRSGVRIEEETWVIVRDVYCQRCRLPWETARKQACHPGDTVLRGGPLGVRRRRDDEELLAERL